VNRARGTRRTGPPGRPGQPRPPGHGDRGQATVELALLLPLVALVLVGVVQVALVARDHALVVHAAREAVRAAAVDDDPAAPRRAAERAGPLAPSRVEVRTTERGEVGTTITAVVTYSSPVRVPLVGALVHDVHLEARATMRVER
jgi:Flp pilus assembly protein TadG